MIHGLDTNIFELFADIKVEAFLFYLDIYRAFVNRPKKVDLDSLWPFSLFNSDFSE